MSATRVKPRKRRTVKNAYVDIDHVAVQPGRDYCDWERITKEKLKEREIRILQIKTSKIESVLDTNIDTKQLRYTVPSDIIRNALSSFYHAIDQWKGGRTSSAKQLTVYRDYFNKAKKWWDHEKNEILGDMFWVPILQNLQQDVKSDFTFLEMLNELFHGLLRYNSTRLQPLFGGQVLLSSSGMTRYLLSVHNSLNIKLWKEQQATASAKAMLSKIQTELDTITACGLSHQQSTAATNQYDKVSRFNTANIPALSLPSNQISHAMSTNTNLSSYGNQRGSTYYVSDARYSPMAQINAYQQQMNNHNNNHNIRIPIIHVPNSCIGIAPVAVQCNEFMPVVWINIDPYVM